MPTLSFPSNPSLNDTYSFGGKTWIYNGSYWALQSTGAINGIPIGNVTPTTGAFTTLTSTGNTTLGDIAGNLVPAANLTYDLGNETNYWRDLYLSGSSIRLGNIVLKNVGGTFSVFQSDGSTPAPVGGVTELINGTSNVVVSASGNVTTGVAGVPNIFVATAGGVYVTGIVDVSGNIDAGNVSATNGEFTNVAGTLTTAVQTNITSVGTLSSLSVTGNISGGNVSGTNLTGTLLTAAQTNITSVGTLDTLTVTGNVAGGNINTSGAVVATGNVSGGNLNVTGNIVDTAALEVITGSNGNITLTPNGTGVVVLNKDLRNGQANGVGNIGSSTGYFNTVFAKATSAQYADLAEIYVSDIDYLPGTVVVFGGQKEITQSTAYAQMSIAGVISTHPAHIMNAGSAGLPVALQGRVPCRVTGTIRKGDLITSSEIAGVATRLDSKDWLPGSVIGKSLEDYDSDEVGTIEVVVGRV